MSVIKVARGWKIDTKKCCSYFQSTLSVFKIPVIKIKRTSYRTVYLFGVPVYKKKISKQATDDSIIELLSATINVSEMPKASGVLRTFQQAEMQLLKKVDSVCQKHGINYWLDFGTLLGAVRHRGMIPWDDDVDISMLRQDYEKFLSICKSEFPEDLYSFNSMGFLQIHVKGTMLQLDVFPYDQAAEAWFPEGEKERQFNKLVYSVTSKLDFDVNLHQDQEDSIVNYSYEQRRELHQLEVMQNRPSAADGNIFLALDIAATKRFTFLYEWIFPLKKLPFEDGMFPCPNKPEMVLFTNYGDWGAVPRNPYKHFNLRNITKRDYLKLLEIANNGL